MANARWYWIAPDGVSVALDEEPIYLHSEMSGHLMPVFKRDEKWLGEFGMLGGLKTEGRDVFLPLTVKAPSLLDALRTVAQYFNPRRGAGKLRMVSDSGARILECQYAGGLEGDGRDGGLGWQKVGIRLRALNPYWQAETAKNFVFEMQPPVTFFQSPFFPLRISSGAINGDVTVTNDGDVDAYPVITASGAFTSLQVNNLDTNRTMTFGALTMTDGDSLVIDTRPSALTVRLNGGNAFGLMSADSSLWAIAPGENHLQIVTTGTNSNSSVIITFTEQFLTV